jgi:hypothetical protein
MSAVGNAYARGEWVSADEWFDDMAERTDRAMTPHRWGIKSMMEAVWQVEDEEEDIARTLREMKAAGW